MSLAGDIQGKGRLLRWEFLWESHLGEGWQLLSEDRDVWKAQEDKFVNAAVVETGMPGVVSGWRNCRMVHWQSSGCS